MSHGTKKTTCSFTIVLKDKKIDEKNSQIDCPGSAKPSKKKPVKDFVYTTKAMMRFTLSFWIKKENGKFKVKWISSAVEKGKSFSNLHRTTPNVLHQFPASWALLESVTRTSPPSTAWPSAPPSRTGRARPSAAACRGGWWRMI